MSAGFKFQDFQSRLNQEFQIEREPGEWATIKLIEASELPFKYTAPDEAERTSFSIVFRAGSDVHLPQNIYTVKHGELGENQIFLVPIQPDETGTLYEAVFT